ncbi:hypothetical protein FCN77_11115 [Arthrobacter sp. 24S4-2]|nr:hypothetical protein FCN77_11115 [Arthrobacter sp. 24S4-2]
MQRALVTFIDPSSTNAGGGFAGLHVGSCRLLPLEAKDDGRRTNGRIRTIGQDLAHEQPFLRPLAAEAFDPSLVLLRLDQDLQRPMPLRRHRGPLHL